MYINTNLLSTLQYFFVVLTQFGDILAKLDKVFGKPSAIKAKRLRALLTFAADSPSKRGTRRPKSTRPAARNKQSGSSAGTFRLDDDSDSAGDSEPEPADAANSGRGMLPDIRRDLSGFRSVAVWKKLGNK